MSKIFSADEVIKIARLSELELTEKEIKILLYNLELFWIILNYWKNLK